MKSEVRILTTDADIERLRAEAEEREPFRTIAVRADYRAEDDTIVIEFKTGVVFTVPRKLLQGLENADPIAVAEIEIVGPGDSLRWESLDVDHYIPSMLEGAFGNRHWMIEIGKRGGASRSPAKSAASRKNGAKGGRPRKVPVQA